MTKRSYINNEFSYSPKRCYPFHQLHLARQKVPNVLKSTAINKVRPTIERLFAGGEARSSVFQWFPDGKDEPPRKGEKCNAATIWPLTVRFQV